MSCEAQDLTLLWAYGEGDEGHGAHVAACAHCQALVAELESVEAHLAPLAPALAPRRRRRWPVALGLAAAAALALALWPSPPHPAVDAQTLQAALELPAPVLDELDALEAQLDLLEDELIDPLEL